MARRFGKTPSELAFSEKVEFVELAKKWRPDAITVLLGLIWQGYDLYQENVLSKIDLTQADDQIERDVTQSLSLYIEQAKSGFEPFYIRSEWFEMEGRKSPRPKQYDLAFVWSNPPNSRIAWPLEAKILRSDKAITEYVNEITNNYLTCGYSPFSSEGRMLGYLLKGDASVAFKNIAKAVPCVLADYPAFPGRDHKTSDHVRDVASDKNYPVSFRCHHLLFQIRY
ncbi:MAG: hypothetical protein AAGD25_32790 [Cyanobacteria bacterium P01_F01_bin.150]